MDARPSGGVRASCPDSDRAALARSQGRFHVPSAISAALCLSCIGPAVRNVGMRWSNSAAVSCLGVDARGYWLRQIDRDAGFLARQKRRIAKMAMGHMAEDPVKNK